MYKFTPRLDDSYRDKAEKLRNNETNINKLVENSIDRAIEGKQELPDKLKGKPPEWFNKLAHYSDEVEFILENEEAMKVLGEQPEAITGLDKIVETIEEVQTMETREQMQNRLGELMSDLRGYTFT